MKLKDAIAHKKKLTALQAIKQTQRKYQKNTMRCLVLTNERITTNVRLYETLYYNLNTNHITFSTLFNTTKGVILPQTTIY